MLTTKGIAIASCVKVLREEAIFSLMHVPDDLPALPRENRASRIIIRGIFT